MLVWAAAPVVSGESWFTPVRLVVMGLHLEVAYLFASRRPLRRNGSLREILMSLPALVVGGLAFGLAPEPAAWSARAAVVFVVGGCWTGASLAWLGSDFAILPAARGVTRTGPYRVVRHPTYLGELIMVAGCAAATGARAWLLVPLAVLVAALRIRAEERLLRRTSPEWREYAERVRWRLVPAIW